MNKFLIIIFLSLIPCLLFSQSTFIQVGDATGLKFSSADSTKLDSIATAFKNILPSGSQSTFKVFTAGIYWHAPNYSGFNEWLEGVLNSAISTYSGQYYLAFFIVKGAGNSTDWRVVTKMNLPSEVYECTEAYYNVLLKSLLQMDFSIDPKDGAVPYNALAEQITTIIPKIGDVVNHMLNCCGRSTECPVGLELDELFFLLENNGYSFIFLDSIAYTLGDTINHTFVKGDQFIAIREDVQINIGNEMGGFFTGLDGELATMGGQSLFFDGTNVNQLLAHIAGNEEIESFQGQDENRGVSSVYSRNGIINLDAVGVQFGSDKFLFARLRVIQPTNGSSNTTGKIHLVRSKPALNINFQSVKEKADYFMDISKVNVPVVLKINGLLETELSINDGIVLIGDNKSNLVELARTRYNIFYCPEDYSTMKIYVRDDRMARQKAGFHNYQFEDTNPETTLNLYLAFISSGDGLLISRYNAPNKEYVIGFIILHVSGHFSGFTHCVSCPDEGSWFMADGNYIMGSFKWNPPSVSLEDYILHKSYDEQKATETRERIKNRFKVN